VIGIAWLWQVLSRAPWSHLLTGSYPGCHPPCRQGAALCSFPPPLAGVSPFPADRELPWMPPPRWQGAALCGLPPLLTGDCSPLPAGRGLLAPTPTRWQGLLHSLAGRELPWMPPSPAGRGLPCVPSISPAGDSWLALTSSTSSSSSSSASSSAPDFSSSDFSSPELAGVAPSLFSNSLAKQ